MRLRASPSRLQRMLTEAGVDLARPDEMTARRVLDVFLEFSRLRVSGLAKAAEDGDLLLAQYGTYAFAGSRLFTVDLTRQFIRRGDDPPIWQLSCTLEWVPSDETDALEAGNLWSEHDLEAFFDDVPRLAGFDWALSGVRPPASMRVLLQRV